MQYHKKFFVILILLITNSLFAQFSDLDIGGYQKYLFGTSKYPGIESRLNDHLLHTRLNLHYYPSENLSAALEFRFRAFYGGSVKKIPGYSKLIQTKRDFVDLDWLIWNSKTSIGYLEADRLYLNWELKNFQMTLGRQRIAWGTCWVWNPTDIFNPLNVLDFDYEELPAADVVRLQYYTGAVSKIEISYKPAKENNKQILAGLISINKWEYDFNFILGYKFNKWLTGFSWAGDISDAGFRGEVLFTEKNRSVPVVLANDPTVVTSVSKFNQSTVSFSLSGDYTFESSFYIHTELLFNNHGVTENTFYFQQAAQTAGMLSAARWSFYQEFAYNFSPLVRGNIFSIINPSDGSFVVIPSVSYSVITNLDFFANIFFFEGNSSTEFGVYGTAMYLRLKYSF